MKNRYPLIRLSLVAALLGNLAACTIVPAAPHGYYRAPSVVVEAYPVYRYGYPYYHYDDDRRDYRAHDHRGDRYYRDGGRSYDSPLEGAARTHRDIRRSLGLPRLPGMP